jgi:aminoglycoside/choline kinase family phosphotransferase
MEPDLERRIHAFLALTSWADARVALLTGDASDRRYARVTRADGATRVLAIHPGAITLAAMPFSSALALFQAMPIPVPFVLAHADALGIIALDDLGDVTLQAHLAATGGTTRPRHYRDAVELIATMQRRGAELASTAYVPCTLAFDVEKLTFELQFFVTHFLEGHRRVKLTGQTRASLAAELQSLATELANEPRVVCHRDYHSRNLMVRDGQLVVIDFQDARMGPDTYDLVSLLRDSYVELHGPEVEALITYFLTLDRGPQGERDAARFRHRFDAMALQRNLKALGTFGFQATVRGKTSYLDDVPRTLGYVRTTFERQPRFAHLHAQLAAHLPELR